MLTLLVEAGCSLFWQSSTIRVEKEQQLVRKVPVKQVEAIWIHGKVLLDSYLLTRLTEVGIAVSFIPARGKGAISWLSHSAGQNSRIRLAQSLAWHDTDLRLKVAMRLLAVKFLSYRAALFNNVFLALDNGKQEFENLLNNAFNNIEKQQRISELMGLEGSVARAWFKLMQLHCPKWCLFKGRNRRPPKDPLNALMSLCYGLIHSEVSKCVSQRGFDQVFGFLHEISPGRDSLALDLLEPFRPILDVFCLSLVAESMGPTDFYAEDNGACKLNKESMSRFFGQLHSYRLDPWCHFELLPETTLWPDRPVDFDGESITWLARQFADCLARDIYAWTDELLQHYPQEDMTDVDLA